MGTLAIMERWDYGYQSWLNYNTGMYRIQLQYFLYGIVPVLYVLAALAVAGAGAAAITTEHEEDTWLSLTATDLTAREVIFAKLWGALVRGRRLAELILLLTAVGVFAGSISPLSIPALIVALSIYGWFAGALGVWISLQLRSTWRALWVCASDLAGVHAL
jgi:hypothetical protein